MCVCNIKTVLCVLLQNRRLRAEIKEQRDETLRWKKMYFRAVKISHQKDVIIDKFQNNQPDSPKRNLSLKQDEYRKYFSGDQLNSLERFPHNKSDYSFISAIISYIFEESEAIPTLSGVHHDHLKPEIKSIVKDMAKTRIKAHSGSQVLNNFRSKDSLLNQHISTALSNLKLKRKAIKNAIIKSDLVPPNDNTVSCSI